MADYHHISKNQFKPTVKTTVTAIRRLKKILGFEQIVCTGISGQSIAWPVGYVTDIPVAVVRRKGEKQHHGYDVENFNRSRKFIILDDFVSSGDTIKHVLKTLSEDDRDTQLCVGVYCYSVWDSAGYVTFNRRKYFVYSKTSKKVRVE
jgi:adenine/guanine phosphoribosyltransferase-like PRPP-binding protein